MRINTDISWLLRWFRITSPQPTELTPIIQPVCDVTFQQPLLLREFRRTDALAVGASSVTILAADPDVQIEVFLLGGITETNNRLLTAYLVKDGIDYPFYSGPSSSRHYIIGGFNTSITAQSNPFLYVPPNTAIRFDWGAGAGAENADTWLLGHQTRRDVPCIL